VTAWRLGFTPAPECTPHEWRHRDLVTTSLSLSESLALALALATTQRLPLSGAVSATKDCRLELLLT
jgi:hypothetical protein